MTDLEDYRKDKWAFTQGRCRSCEIIFAWRTRASARLKHGPGCPECGTGLTRTAVMQDSKRAIQVREPLWGKLAAQVRRMERAS